MPDEQLTYAASGVDIDEAHRALRAIAGPVQATHGDRVLGGIGGFGGMFSGLFPEFKTPVLVSSIDGIGTKTKVAAMAGDYSGLGADIVNHCVNDILCQGAKPLFFLDYFGCSQLNASVFEQVVTSAARACAEVGCALIGGETAEMPGVYLDGEIDIVGSIVGAVDLEGKLPRYKPAADDKLIGLASDGLHTNGYSLARRALFEIGGLSVRDTVPGTENSIAEILLRPHRCYFNSVYPLVQESPDLLAIAHITGGGLYDNVPRIIPSDMQAVIHRRTWTPPPIFQMIGAVGSVPDPDMYRTFNMGIGMVLVVRQEAAHVIVRHLNESGEHAAEIGELQNGPHDVQIV